MNIHKSAVEDELRVARILANNRKMKPEDRKALKSFVRKCKLALKGNLPVDNKPE